MVPKQPDKILILIDVLDPLTYDKIFYRSLAYSPYVTQVDSMSERNRQAAIQASKHVAYDDEEATLLSNKFVIDVNPMYFGEFMMQFVSNPEQQRHLSYLDYRIEPIPAAGVSIDDLETESIKSGVDLEELMESFPKGLVHVYELRSGVALDVDDSEDGDDSEEDEDDEDEPSPKSRRATRSASPTGPTLMILEDDGDHSQPRYLESSAEGEDEVVVSGPGFVLGAPKTIH